MSGMARTAMSRLSMLALCVALAPACRDVNTDLAAGPAALEASAATAPWQPGAVIVKFTDEWAPRADRALAADLGLEQLRRSRIGVHLMGLGTGETVPEAVERLGRDPRVEYAEPNHRIRFLNVPDDPRFGECWGLHNTGQTGGAVDADIDAPEAWDISIGSRSVVVAVLDTGVDYTHPDLQDNMWTNQDEIPDNGVDDDDNGYVDDVIGWDFDRQINDPMDDYNHGTHCAGIIGAMGNNDLGVAGVAWRVTIMPLRIIGDQDLDAFCLEAAEAIHYAVDNGARIMSCSWWTIEHYSLTLENAVQYSDQQGIILVAAAGNDSRDDDDPNYSHWPSEWPYDNIIAVAATDHHDGRAFFSNWGPTTVDVGAPGEDVLSTVWPGHGYDWMSGTSMAAPHVAGSVALMLSIRPDLSVAEVKQFLFNTVDPIPDLQGLTVTGGRINAHTALQAISGVPLPPVALAGGERTAMTGTTVFLDGSASFDPNQDPITYRWLLYTPGNSNATLDDETIATPRFLADVCGLYQAFLTVEDDGGLRSDPDRARVHVTNWADQDPPIETPHPYDNYMDQTWTVTIPGSVVMGVHFASFETDRYYDLVHILDGDDAERAVYDGELGEFNSVLVEGNTIKIRFTSDYSGTGYGFVIDGVWWCDAGNCPSGQGDCNDDPADGCETDTFSDIDNCGWCGHACSFPDASFQCSNGLCELVACAAGFEDCDGEVANGCEAEMDNDPLHCGFCGNACSDVYPNADVACAGGACQMGACNPGWDDCNEDPADGCETSVAADPDNCGGCGVRCILPNAAHTYCEDAVCHLGDCAGGWGDCDGDPSNGCEQGVWDDDANCGGCNITCNLPHTTAHCAGVYCVIDACGYGWDDCDGAGRNGCEADLGNDPENCGECGAACTIPGATAICLAGACEIGECRFNLNDCNGDPTDGCESDGLSDPENCGRCGFACSANHTDSRCINGTCFMDDCHEGFADCNRDDEDGCEVSLGEDSLNCGSCGRVCELQNATAACSGGECVVVDCARDRGDCDGEVFNGCEVDLTSDPDHCGACGRACDLANATAECRTGGCLIFICDNGFADCNGEDDDGCEVDKLYDPDNCGHCRLACREGQTCEMGVCLCVDEDGDGHESAGCGGDDCDDSNADVNPSADEDCDDRVDNDCDGEIDESCEEEEPVTTSGCGCGSGAGSASSWSWLGLLGLPLVRRRN